MKDSLIKMREYIRADKPKKLREGFTFSAPLERGWMLRYLLPLESAAWGRWDYWAETTSAGKLLAEPIPQIEWAAEHGESSHGRRMLEKSLNTVVRCGDWKGWSGWQYFDYFLDWILFGFGHLTRNQFVEMFCAANKCHPSTVVTRISFGYV